MKFIKLTECYKEPKDIYINVEMIGAIHQASDRRNTTCLKHLSHNNGGYYIKETPIEILRLIEKAKAL
jgi:hypothetical protein